jgi:glutathione S-transferase
MITFYNGSGSPFGWRVWLALEHKGIPYELRMLSFDQGDLKKPEFLALNPRGRVPTIVHDGFPLGESSAIVEYLERVWPEKPLFPSDAQKAAVVRRIIREVDSDYGVPNEELVDEVLYTEEPERDVARIAGAKDKLVKELALWNEALEKKDWLAGELSAADFALYPFVALTLRMEKRAPAVGVGASIGKAFRAWMARVESLPYFAKTYPPHWRS